MWLLPGWITEGRRHQEAGGQPMTATRLRHRRSPSSLLASALTRRTGTTFGVSSDRDLGGNRRRGWGGAVFLGANFTWTNGGFGAFAILFGLTSRDRCRNGRRHRPRHPGRRPRHHSPRAAHRDEHDPLERRASSASAGGSSVGASPWPLRHGFTAVTVGTCGDAIVALGQRLVDTVQNDAVQA